MANANNISGSLDALLTKPANATLTTSLGQKIPLPANWSAAIPRATLAASAANILKRAVPAAMVGYGLYQLLSPLIHLNSDGTVSSGLTNGAYSTSAAASAACVAAADSACKAYYNSAWSSGSGGVGVCDAQNASDGTHGNYLPACYSYSVVKNVPSPSAYADFTWGQSGTATPTPVTEPELANKIEQSSATGPELLNRALADAASNAYDASTVLPLSTPASVSASQVVGPFEITSSSTSPNPDGSTTTKEVKEQITATPQTHGTTAADAGVDWQTSTTKTTTATNNTTGQTTTSTETINSGTSTTTVQQTDYCQNNPGALGCQQIGTTIDQPAMPVGEKAITATFTQPASVAGSCPTNTTVTLNYGGVVGYDYAPICTFASGIRPAVIAVSFLGGLFIVFGFKRGDA